MAEWREAVLHSPAYLSLLNGEDERFWEQHGETYIRNRSSGEHVRRVKSWLAHQLPPSASVIEIGPGPGIFTRFLSEHCASVTAVEPSPANAARLRRKLTACDNLSVVQEKWEKAALAPHDAVFSAGTLYVFPDIEAALLKMLGHAYGKVLLVTMDEEQFLAKEAAAALGLEVPASPQLSVLLPDVLKSMGLSFSCEQFSEETEYLYPHPELVADLWKGSLGLRKEHRSALELFFRRKGLYAEDGTAVRVPRRFTTYLLEISSPPAG
jgi:hypothetical protein